MLASRKPARRSGGKARAILVPQRKPILCYHTSMKNAVILHGKPSKELFYDPSFPSTSNYYWLPWLQKQLVLRDISAATPEVPNAWIPDYPVWKREFERYDITPETILVGHSCGAGFLLRWLSEHSDVLVEKVVLAAPWLNPNNREHSKDFFEFTLDKNLAKRRVNTQSRFLLKL